MEKIITLYEMTSDLIELMEAEINEEVINEIIENIKIQIETKAENIIAVIRNYETRIEGIKNEEKRLAEYRKSEEKKLESLKQYTTYCMEKLGNKKLDTNLGRIALRKKPASLNIVDEDLIPDEYKKIIQTIKIDKAQIKKDLKDKKIEGVELIEGENSLQIK
jgi:hypothetical protein